MPVKEGLFVESETRVFQQPELIDGTVLEQENHKINRLGKKLVVQSSSGRREATMQDIRFSVKPETMECMEPDAVVSAQGPGFFKKCETQDLVKLGSRLVEPKNRTVVEQLNRNEHKILASTYALPYNATGKDKLYSYANMDNGLNSQVKHIPKTVYKVDFSQPENLAFDSTNGEYILVPYVMPKDFLTDNDNRNKFGQQEMQMYQPSSVSNATNSVYQPSSVSHATNSAHISTGQTSDNFTVL
jgi:hypothetical protein